MKPFNDNKVLINIIKKLCKVFDIDFNNFWKEVVYKIDKQRRGEDCNQSLLDTFNNIESIKSSEIDSKYKEIMAELEKQLNNKIFKIQTKINLITKHDVNNTIKLLDFIKLNNTWIDSIKYETGSNYVIESSSEFSNQDNHNDLIELINNHCSEYNVNAKIC